MEAKWREMKQIVVVLLGMIWLAACSVSRPMMPTDKNLISLESEEDQYEVMVLDPGFESWFITTWSRANDRSEAYYSNWNQQYVLAWNYKASQPHTSQFFNNRIEYDPNIRYGIDVERKLYYYFRWVDTKLGIPILDTPRPGGIL